MPIVQSDALRDWVGAFIAIANEESPSKPVACGTLIPYTGKQGYSDTVMTSPTPDTVKCAKVEAADSMDNSTPQQIVWHCVEGFKRSAVDFKSKIDVTHHVSLSRCFPLRFRQLDAFVSNVRETLREQVTNAHDGRDPLQRFALTLGRIRVFTNDDASRTFISLCPGFSGVDSADGTANAGADQLIRIIREVVDPACATVGAQTFYKPAEPHMSIAWAAGDVRKQFCLKRVLSKMKDHGWSSVPVCRTLVATIECRTGNRCSSCEI